MPGHSTPTHGWRHFDPAAVIKNRVRGVPHVSCWSRWHGRDEAALAHSIVGRTEERAVLDRFMGDALAEPRVLLIEGEAGIGKSTLLDDLLDTAAPRGTVVLACRPSHSEMDLSYAGLIE
jgi:hypothetical protein